MALHIFRIIIIIISAKQLQQSNRTVGWKI